MKSKQGVILLETILSIALFFIIISTTTSVMLNLQERSKLGNEQTSTLLTLESTKQFLVNNSNLSKLIYSDKNLYYKGNLLLKDISQYTMNSNDKVVTIELCVTKNKVCAKWKIKK